MGSIQSRTNLVKGELVVPKAYEQFLINESEGLNNLLSLLRQALFLAHIAGQLILEEVP